MTTQYATASYQEVIDLHTETNRVSVLGVHTPVTDAPYAFLQGFFDAFQKYHYDGCSMSLVPAARLPADPSQVSYPAGSKPIDPRDLLNPILWHGAHGESLGSVLNQFYNANVAGDVTKMYSDSVDHTQVYADALGDDAVWQSLYYRALTDNSWKKAHPQQGFRINGLHPLVYSVGTNQQFINSLTGSLNPITPFRSAIPGAPDGVNVTSGTSGGTLGTGSSSALNALGAEGYQSTSGTSSNASISISQNRSGQQFFTERLHGLGWLDTRSRTMGSSDSQSVIVSGDPLSDRYATESLYSNVENAQKINMLPRLFMGICLLPPAYKAEQYYRLVLNHRFSFKKFRGLSTRGDIVGRFGAGTAPGYTSML